MTCRHRVHPSRESARRWTTSAPTTATAPRARTAPTSSRTCRCRRSSARCILEADRLGFLAPQINQAMLERERGVVQNEKRQGENQPYGRVFTHVFETLYPPAHPYSWPIIGSMDDLNAASLQDVKDWYATYYGPNNCVLSLAGDITPERALALVKKYFDGIPPGPPVDRAEQWVPRLDAQRARPDAATACRRRASTACITRPPWRDGDAARLQLLASVLSGSRSARLDRRLVYDQELATTVNAGMDTQELASLFVDHGHGEGRRRPGARSNARWTPWWREFLKQGPTEAELQRARSRILADFVARRRAAGRLRRPLGHPRREHDVRRPPRRLSRSPGAPGHVHGRTGARQRRRSGSTRRTTRCSCRPSRRCSRARRRLDRNVLPPLGEPPDVDVPRRAARHAIQRR